MINAYRMGWSKMAKTQCQLTDEAILSRIKEMEISTETGAYEAGCARAMALYWEIDS